MQHIDILVQYKAEVNYLSYRLHFYDLSVIPNAYWSPFSLDNKHSVAHILDS